MPAFRMRLEVEKTNDVGGGKGHGNLSSCHSGRAKREPESIRRSGGVMDFRVRVVRMRPGMTKLELVLPCPYFRKYLRGRLAGHADAGRDRRYIGAQKRIFLLLRTDGRWNSGLFRLDLPFGFRCARGER